MFGCSYVTQTSSIVKEMLFSSGMDGYGSFTSWFKPIHTIDLSVFEWFRGNQADPSVDGTVHVVPQHAFQHAKEYLRYTDTSE